jgi:hypothetical protein
MSRFDDELEARIAQLLQDEDGAGTNAGASSAPTPFAAAEAAASELDSYFGSDRLQFVASAPDETDEQAADPDDPAISWRVAVWWDDAPSPLGFVHLLGAKREFEPYDQSAAVFIFNDIDAIDAPAFLPLLREELLSGLAEMLTTDLDEDHDDD